MWTYKRYLSLGSWYIIIPIEATPAPSILPEIPIGRHIIKVVAVGVKF